MAENEQGAKYSWEEAVGAIDEVVKTQFPDIENERVIRELHGSLSKPQEYVKNVFKHRAHVIESVSNESLEQLLKELQRSTLLDSKVGCLLVGYLQGVTEGRRSVRRMLDIDNLQSYIQSINDYTK